MKIYLTPGGHKLHFFPFTMNYGPTSPRSRLDIYGHPYWQRNKGTQEILANAINRQERTFGSLRQLSRYFDPGDSHLCQAASARGTIPKKNSSRAIFDDPTILPYYFSPTEQSQLNPTQESKWRQALTVYRTARTGRRPAIYRITDFTFCDDMGRIYHRDPRNPRTLQFAQYQLTKPADYRNGTWIQGYKGDVWMSAYIAIGYAGFAPDIQTKMYTSLKFDVHHVDENKFDVRPSTVLPLPTWMHLRWVHAADYNKIQNKLFKKKAPEPWK